MIAPGERPDLGGDRLWQELRARLLPFVARRVRVPADVDDVLQDVLLRIQRGLPALRDDQRFGPWVYQVARSAVADHLRSAARQPLALVDPAELSADEAAAPARVGALVASGSQHSPEADERAVEQEVAGYLAFFVATLPSPYREALTLTEIEGLPQKQAAELLGVSLSGMKSRVQRGRDKLRAALEACCHIALDARKRVIGCEPRPGKVPEGCCVTPSRGLDSRR